MRRRAQLVFITMVFLSACGGGQKKVEGPGAASSPAGQRFPALVRVPARATYAGAVVRLELLARLVRDLAGLWPTPSSPWASSPGLAQALDQELRKSLGMSPIDPADLAQHGFAVDGAAAVFSTGAFPTFLVPVADRARVEKLLQGATRQTTVIVAEHRGVHTTTWISGDLLVAHALVTPAGGAAGYLVIHMGSAAIEKGQTGWIDEVLDAGAGIAAEADLAWAFEQAGARKDAVGLVRAPALGDALRAMQARLGLAAEKGCEALDQRAAGTLGRIALAATLGDGKVDGAAFVELSRAAGGALAAHLAASPDGRYYAARAEAGFEVSTGLDLDWTSQLAREFGRADCGVVWGALSDLELWQLSDPFAALYGKRIFNSYHAAVLGARVAGSSLDLQAVAWLGVADAGTLGQLLDVFVPGPFKSHRKVAGHDVTRLNLSLLQVAEPAEMIHQAGALRAAMGRGMIERLLEGQASQAPARELFSLRFRADKFTDLAAPLGWLATRMGGSERDAEPIARLLARFRWFGVDALLEDAGIRVAGGFELR